MIRSSRIPPLLDKICTDGIISSLLISKDGELLGSSTKKSSSSSGSNWVPSNKIPLEATSTPTPTTTDDIIMIGSSSSSTTSSQQPPASTLSWMNMNPSDVGALIAEILEDYKRLGCELALLDPTFPFSTTSNSRNSLTSNIASKSGTGVTNTSTGAMSNSNENINNDSNNKGNTTSTNEQLQQDASKEDGTKNTTTTSTGGSDGNKIKVANNNPTHKERGRMNCLIMELETGVIGITSATSSTYVIALAETTTQHGLLKDKLHVLANLFQDSLELVCYA